MKSEEGWERYIWESWYLYAINRIYRKTAQSEYHRINNLKSIIEDNFPESKKDLSL